MASQKTSVDSLMTLEPMSSLFILLITALLLQRPQGPPSDHWTSFKHLKKTTLFTHLKNLLQTDIASLLEPAYLTHNIRVLG